MQLREFKLDLVANAVEFVTGVMLVDVIGGLDQLRGRIGFVGNDDAVLHIAIGGDDDQQHALF